MHVNGQEERDVASERVSRPALRPGTDENGRVIITPEMREIAEAVAHPDGDPYLNGRKFGFYCEQCG